VVSKPRLAPDFTQKGERPTSLPLVPCMCSPVRRGGGVAATLVCTRSMTTTSGRTASGSGLTRLPLVWGKGRRSAPAPQRAAMSRRLPRTAPSPSSSPPLAHGCSVAWKPEAAPAALDTVLLLAGGYRRPRRKVALRRQCARAECAARRGERDRGGRRPGRTQIVVPPICRQPASAVIRGSSGAWAVRRCSSAGMTRRTTRR
jgi:hypothetical protein